jgi:hypothetical protein
MTTVRTIKLKRSPLAADTVPENIQEVSPATETGTATPESTPEESATPLVAKATVSGKSYLWFVVMASLATIGILVIMGLQYSEWTFYGADPSVWLKK